VDAPTTDMIQGTLDMLILKTLSLEPLHDFGIARRIEQISRGVFRVNPGSLLTAVQRLERAGWLDAEWRQTESGRRPKYYALTRAGRKRPASSHHASSRSRVAISASIASARCGSAM
jgi:PadR family transcriptional regulator PadR